MKKLQQASIFLFKKKGRILIHSLSRVQMGASIATEPYIWLDVAASEKEVAQAILKALSCSGDGLPTPDNWKLFQQSFLESIGLKKQRDLQAGVVSVGILRRDDKIFFSPMTNLGSKGGFVNAPGEKIQIPVDSSAYEISNALQEALNKSE